VTEPKQKSSPNSPSGQNPFLAALKTRPLLADGAMGTLLYSRGASFEGCFERLNSTHQEIIQQVHVDYLSAGADIIETNSFSGNRFKLAQHSLENEVWKLNVWAAKIARNAREIVGSPAFVAGSIGPTGKLLPPLGDTAASELESAFQEQMEALLAGGVDLFIIETMSSLEETAIAVRAARKVSTLPVVAQLSFSVEGHTLLGATPEDVTKLLTQLGDQAPDVIGINCGAGPGPVFDSLIRLTSAVKKLTLPKEYLTFSCLPNAGQPSLMGGRPVFQSKPLYCATYVEPYLRAGARIIGGCCGTTPEHIKAMRTSLDTYIQENQTESSKQALTLSSPVVVQHIGDKTEEAPTESPSHQGSSSAPLPLRERLERIKKEGIAKDFYVSVELDPPKGAGTKKLLKAAELLGKAGADAINVGDSPMARVRMSSLAACQLISRHTGLETIIHFTTRDRNLMGMQADLLGCQALGLHNILALTGDPPALGNYAHATAVYDVDSIGLIKIIHGLNQGHDIAGNTIGTPLTLSIGCALNPTASNRALELERIKRKIEAGAHYIMTQPIYQLSDLKDFLDELGGVEIPLLVGIMPLHSSKHAEYLHNEVPGISIAPEIREAMADAGENGAQVGLALAQELLESLMTANLCQGTYLVPSFGRYDDMAQLVDRIKSRHL
jgi:homocysteine S-methyltransferase